jgi:2-polyprenyl-3-methyl-5-hydroxy-6-metoxy-1,4-benzoquinol methylase
MICGQNKIVKRFAFRGYQVYVCENCGIQFLDPQPSDDELSRIYSTDYFLGGDNPRDRELVMRMKRSTASLYLDQFLKETKPDKSELNSHSLLEIGCGMGDFLIEANSKGFKVSGLEVSDYLVHLTNQRLGSMCVEKGTIETSSFQAGSFDIIAFFDVIEHVRNPLLFMKKVSELLKVYGKVFIVTPSLDSGSARLLQKHWMEYKVEHLFYFNQKSLRLLFEKTGFHNIKFIPNYKILNFDYINNHFVRYPVNGLTPLIGMIRRIAPDALAYIPIKLIASGIAAIAEKI